MAAECGGMKGYKYSLYFGFHFEFSLPNYRKSRFIRILMILVTEYLAYFTVRNIQVALKALALSMLLV